MAKWMVKAPKNEGSLGLAGVTQEDQEPRRGILS